MFDECLSSDKKSPNVCPSQSHRHCHTNVFSINKTCKHWNVFARKSFQDIFAFKFITALFTSRMQNPAIFITSLDEYLLGFNSK